MEKKLGKITHASFGFGGYQDAMIGLTLTFYMDGTGCGDFKGAWSIERSEHAKWTEAERITSLGETVMFLAKTLEQAKVKTVNELIGIPVEVSFEGMAMKEWRILEEVL